MTEWRATNHVSYEVSDDGRVRNMRTGRVLRATGDRYLMVSLGRARRALVHRLVAQAFLGDGAGLQVNHKNGDRKDNRVQNLEWVTASENNMHSRRVLKKCLGEDHGLARLTWVQVDEIRQRAHETARKLANEFGVSDVTIASIRKGRTWAPQEQKAR